MQEFRVLESKDLQHMDGVEESTGDKEPKRDSHSLDTDDSPPRVSQDKAQGRSVQHQTASRDAKHYTQGRHETLKTGRQETLKTGRQNLPSKTTPHSLNSLSKVNVLWKEKPRN